MSEDTNAISLREYIEKRFDLANKELQTTLLAAERAIAKAELANEKQFDSIRQETLARITALVEKIEQIEKRLNLLQGESSGTRTHTETQRHESGDNKSLIAIIIAVGTVLAQVVVFLARR